ncbi:MAG: sodium/proline symporter PutP [Gammaproteobacteria bacterium]|jgi:sodium/proline symporter|uniref:Sodium/proline symporter n=1 Tax=Marinomonas polaris DSM 16579 TaxID=1122206 RepID=A0A1M5BP16_9GAMM|nr:MULTISPECIES: sodium/proline symporter PutP [Marinomonas]MBU1293638.1 sodium/proline symporter PutP [Gammaproteobacteria bacterium]MBU1468925.1 sodium/proline symporter PutP [Gammaproteobacteria bacterium]MBU2024272.1 sodium/proline symporter PutP [Gammaproteobacteria bacterium]MBU2237593.1 sodium/proline symporter PutP [Gammaproteobacteria bacterium]MBU2318961.1 sodium/proline symporter PutP [Gammaproteobacteria bacterium]
MIESSYAISFTFLAYLVVMLGIGLYAYKRTSSSEDYFLGGRSLGPWPTALSAGASDMSGWLLLGLPGYAFAAGLESFWIAGGLFVGTWLNWLICAKRLRTYSIKANNALTLPDFLSTRFNDKSKLIQTISALFILLFFLFYTSSGLVAGGKLFETVFGLDYTYAVIIGTVCVVSYTLFGGFLAVAWTDLVQGLMMSAALVIVPLVAIDGGWSELSSTLMAKNPNLLDIWTNVSGEPLTAIGIISLVAWGLGYFGQPHILARFKASRSNKDIKTARRIAVIWTFISMAGALLIGLVGITFVDSNLTGNLADPEKIFMILVNAVFHPVVAGILLAAILAAIMSTADSQLLVSSSALAEDFYKQLFNKEATQKQIVNVGRFAVVAISIIALLLALNPESSVLGLVSYAWAGFGAAFGPAILLSLFWRNMNRNGALAGIVIGGVTVVVWKQLTGGIFDLYEIVPGFLFSTIAIFAVSLATGAPEESVTESFDEYEKALDTMN